MFSVGVKKSPACRRIFKSMLFLGHGRDYEDGKYRSGWDELGTRKMKDHQNWVVGTLNFEP
jgi:hypothetical protein